MHAYVLRVYTCKLPLCTRPLEEEEDYEEDFLEEGAVAMDDDHEEEGEDNVRRWRVLSS